MLYVLLDVQDNRLIFDAQGAGAHETRKFGDRIWLGLQNPDGAERQVLITATSTGPVQARHIETRELGQEITVAEPRIAGAWQPSAQGYRVELRVPLSLLGNQFGVLIDDRDVRGAQPKAMVRCVLRTCARAAA
jgi:two-component system, OmpR family, sensor histidine kinase ChvG